MEYQIIMLALSYKLPYHMNRMHTYRYGGIINSYESKFPSTITLLNSNSRNFPRPPKHLHLVIEIKHSHTVDNPEARFTRKMSLPITSIHDKFSLSRSLILKGIKLLASSTESETSEWNPIKKSRHESKMKAIISFHILCWIKHWK